VADYATQTFVDDDGSATTGTVLTKAIMDHIEAGIADAASHHRIGLFASMPAAAAANKNWLWIATDTDGSGGLYLSDGSTWSKVLTPIDGQFGDGSDGSWTALTTPTNVLANPDAEGSVSGWSGFFTGGGSGSGPNRVSDAGAGSGSFAFELSETSATGAGVLLMYPAGIASFTGSVRNVVAGQVVEFSGQMKAQAGTFTSLKLTARWLDASGNLLTGGEVDVTGAIQNSPVVGTWYSLSGTLIAPAGAAFAGLEVIGTFGGSGSYTMRVDNLASRPLMPGTTRSGATYTLTRDVYFTDLTVNSGVTVKANGYRLYCRGKLSGAGTISHNGAAGSGVTGGTGAGDGSVKGGWGSGGAGGNGAANGAASLTAPGLGHGGSGGGGGAGTSFTGGASTGPTTPDGGVRRALPELINPFVWRTSGSPGAAPIGGGGAGGGGGGATGGTGGGGGGAGGVLIIVAHVIAGTVALQAKGGDGAAATTNGGGGGGGGGGAIHLLYADKSGWTGTTDVSGGAAGAKNGTGTIGTAGSAGNVIQLAAA
jgi:hypothetical protein